jgi:hypothetical protein
LDWKRELVIAHLVKQKISEVDVDSLWENTLPDLGASEEQLLSLEMWLGYDLDPQHKDFLRHANGWRGLMQDIDVLSIEDLVGGPRAGHVAELVESLDPIEALCGLSKNDMLPIAVASTGIDVMMMARPHTGTPGQVMWFAGGLIDTFAGFDEWFLAMVDHNREEYQRLAKKHGAAIP